MWEWMHQLFSSAGFMPHGYCLTWSKQLLVTMVVANGVVALAYFSIPIALYRLVRLQPHLGHRGIFLMFSAFIFACGTTHVMGIVNIWFPFYRLDAAIMAITAGVSMATALMLWPLVPVASAEIDRHMSVQQALGTANDRLNDAMAALGKRNREIEESEQRFRLALEGAPIGLVICAPDGRFLESNQIFCNMIGYSREELRSMDFQHLTHPEDLPADLAKFKQLLDGQIPSYTLEKRYLRRSGAELEVQLDVSLLRDHEGRPYQIIGQIQDITTRKRNELALRRSEEKARLLSQLDGILQSCLSIEEMQPSIAHACAELFPDSSGRVYLINASRTYLEAFADWGAPVCSELLFAPEDCWALRRGRSMSVRHDQRHATRCRHVHQSSERLLSLCLPMTAQSDIMGVVYLEMPLSPQAEQADQLRGALEQTARAFADRTSVAIANLRLRDRLRDQAIRDPLTGLYNRRYLEEALNRDLARAEREQGQVALMMIDIDHFKRFNDTHGHIVGDSALKLVAEEIQNFCRKGDIASRHGGEEFALAMIGLTHAQAQARAEELCTRIRLLSLSNRAGQPLSVTISVGLAVYPLHGLDYPQLMEAADRALYRAKQQGRDRVVVAAQTAS
jgi:diguanylate cyclase (GGDEF)-like protein/PAS domain S-box-containing protein